MSGYEGGLPRKRERESVINHIQIFFGSSISEGVGGRGEKYIEAEGAISREAESGGFASVPVQYPAISLLSLSLTYVSNTANSGQG